MEPGTRDTIVLRPSSRDYWQGLKARAWVLVPVLLVTGGSLLARRSSGALWFGGLVLVAVVCLALVLVHLQTAQVRLEPGRVTRTGALVRDVTLPLDGQVRGLLAPYRQPLTATADLLVLCHEPDGPRLRLNGGMWARTELLQIARYAGATVSEDAHSAAEFEAAVAGSMPWRERRPYRFAFLVAGAIVVFVVAAVVGGSVLANVPPFDRQPPQGISAASASAQDSLVAALEAAAPGPWGTANERYYTCQDDSRRKGWYRWVTVRRDSGAAWTPDQTSAVSTLLVARGFNRPRPDATTDPVLVRALTDGPIAGPTSSVEVYGYADGHATIEVHSPCEVVES